MRLLKRKEKSSKKLQLYVKIKVDRAADLVLDPGFSSGSVDDVALKQKRSKASPVLVAQLNDAKKRTSKRSSTNHPSWDNILLLPMKLNAFSPVVNFTVWDRYNRSKTYLGELRVSLRDIFTKNGQFTPTCDPRWYRLYSNSEYRSFVTGSVLLSFELVTGKKTRKSPKGEKEAGRKLDTDAGVAVQIIPPSREPTRDLYEQMDQLSLSDTEITPVMTNYQELEGMYDVWQKSLVYPDPDPAVLFPDDQGFYTEASAADLPTGDISDIDSILPVSAPSSLHDGRSINLDNALIPVMVPDSTVLSIVDSDLSDSSMVLSDISSAEIPIGESHSAKDAKRRSQERKKMFRRSLDQRIKNFGLANRAVLGVLFLEIVSCSDLPPLTNITRTTFDMDPFVVVTFGKKTFRTSWKRHTLNPIFNERLAFEVLPNESNFNVLFSVLDKDHFSFHDEVADGTVLMKDITSMATAASSAMSHNPMYMNEGNEESMLSFVISDSGYDSSTANSNFEVLEDDNIVHHLKKRGFRHKRKVIPLYADTSKFKTMDVKLLIHKEKYREKYNPRLKIRVRFEPYLSLRKQFWKILLEQYGLNEVNGSYDYIELISFLDALGCNNSDEIVFKFFENSGKLAWGGDRLKDSEIIEELENHINGSKGDEESRIFEIEKCPICCQKKLSKKGDNDIITHVAICSSKDWSIVSKLLVSSYVTPQIATKKWFTKFLIKISYGKYSLGGNSANILVQDRMTGIIMEEKMGVYVRLGIRLLYKGLDKARKRRVRALLYKASVKQGAKFDHPHLKNDIASFIKFHKLDLSDCLYPDLSHYNTFNEFFYRKLKPDARPNEAPNESRIAVSPADSRCTAFSTVGDATRLWIKGTNFSVAKLFNGNFENLELTDLFKPDACSLAIFRLAPQDYHRFHCPVDGVVGKIKFIEGEYYTVNPMAIRSELDVFGENVRVIIPIKTREFGTVVMVAVGAMMVGSTVLTRNEGDEVKRGDEMGYFKFGGSTVILLAEKKRLNFDSDIVKNSLSCIETLVRVGQSIGHAPDVSEYKRDHVDFHKQTRDFKRQLIRVITGGDLSSPAELNNWEATNLKLNQADFDDLGAGIESSSSSLAGSDEDLIESEDI